MEAKKGDILFYSETGPVAKAIQRITEGPFNHCEICVSDNVTMEVRPSGISLIDLIFKDRQLKEGEYIIVKRPKWENMNAGILKALEILKDVKGYSLGNVSMWWSNMKRARKVKDDRFKGDDFVICSELVGDCLLAGGMECKVDYDTSLQSPNDIFNNFEYFNGEIKIIGEKA